MALSETSEWESDEAMDVLFSPFRENRELNPRAWDRKMKFWTQATTQTLALKKCAVFDARSLAQSFVRKGKTPACIGKVVEDMLSSGKALRMSDFTRDTGWFSWGVQTFIKKPVQWGFDLVKKPVSWTWGKVVGEQSTNTTSPDEQLVCIDVVKKIAAEILERHCSTVQHELTDNIVTYADLRRRCGVIVTDQRSFDLALLQLCREQKCSVVSDDNQEKLVVFARGKSLPPVNLSENDLRIFRLKLAENTLNNQIKELENSKKSLRQEAKNFINLGNKAKAKACLVKKQRAHQLQLKKEQSLEQIENLLSMIQQAETHKQILDAFKSGTEVFEDIRMKYGLTTDAIDKVMDGVKDVFDTQADLDESLSQIPSMSASFDTSLEELEEELEGILAGGSEEEPVSSDQQPAHMTVGKYEVPHQDLINSMCKMTVCDEDILPDVPSHDPGSPLVRPSFASSPVASGHQHSYTALYDLPTVPGSDPQEKTKKGDPRQVLFS